MFLLRLRLSGIEFPTVMEKNFVVALGRFPWRGGRNGSPFETSCPLVALTESVPTVLWLFPNSEGRKLGKSRPDPRRDSVIMNINVLDKANTIKPLIHPE